jgi:RNA polymerase sigma-70 factor (sigma-E family)
VDSRLADYVGARWNSLVGYAAVVSGESAEAEDLVQTVLVKVAIRWPLLRDKDDLDAYVRTAIVRTQISRWRRRRIALDAAPAPTVHGGASYDDTERTDTSLAVASALRQLPPRQRAVLVLRYLADRSEAQTAAALGCSVGTVKSQTSKALSTLRRRWPDLLDPDEAREVMS